MAVAHSSHSRRCSAIHEVAWHSMVIAASSSFYRDFPLHSNDWFVLSCKIIMVAPAANNCVHQPRPASEFACACPTHMLIVRWSIMPSPECSVVASFPVEWYLSSSETRSFLLWLHCDFLVRESLLPERLIVLAFLRVRPVAPAAASFLPSLSDDMKRTFHMSRIVPSSNVDPTCLEPRQRLRVD